MKHLLDDYPKVTYSGRRIKIGVYQCEVHKQKTWLTWLCPCRTCWPHWARGALPCMRDLKTHGFGADKSKQVYLLQLFTKLKEVKIKHSQSRELEAKATSILEGVTKHWCGLIALYRAEIGFRFKIIEEY